MDMLISSSPPFERTELQDIGIVLYPPGSSRTIRYFDNLEAFAEGLLLS